jgi:hypothetical protein
MASNVWANIAMGSTILSASSGLLGGLGSVIGGDTGKTLADIGGIAGQVAKLGVQVGTTGAFAQSSSEQKAAALANAAPVVAVLGAQQPAGAAAKPADPSKAAVVEQARTGCGIGDALGQIIELPFKIIGSVLGALTGR